jgi:hypothetical protein
MKQIYENNNTEMDKMDDTREIARAYSHCALALLGGLQTDSRESSFKEVVVGENLEAWVTIE